MTTYWLLFAFFALGAFLTTHEGRDSRKHLNIFYVLGGIIITIVVGVRYEVGADWDAYKRIYEFSERSDLTTALRFGDPGYQALNWAVSQIGGGMLLVNLICALIFTWGLLRFCAVQEKPWLAILTSISYAVIVVAMGYTRQGVALGILMAGMAIVLRGGSILRLALYVTAAALFHKTAIVAFPLVALTMQRNRVVNFILVLVGCYLLYDTFLAKEMDNLYENYIQQKYSSQGATIRVLMSLFAAAIFVLARRHIRFSEQEARLWRNFSLVTFGLFILLLVSPSSTAVDRLSLYTLPLQLAVWARVPQLLRSPIAGTAAVVSYAFAVQFVWLNYAQFARLWIPYRFTPF